MLRTEKATQIIQAEQVLSYLNELGYTNISAQLLKEFLKDLKKLVKSFEKKHSDPEYRPIDPLYNEQCRKVRASSWRKENTEKETQTSIFCSQFEDPATDCIPRTEQQISVHLLKKVCREPHEHCIHTSESTNVESKRATAETSKERLESETVSTLKSTRPSSKGSSGSKPNVQLKDRRAKIKPAANLNKCDPVSLYHHYQSEWKKVKFPGEETHASLRRFVRDKLRSDIKVMPMRSRSSSRRSCHC